MFFVCLIEKNKTLDQQDMRMGTIENSDPVPEKSRPVGSVWRYLVG